MKLERALAARYLLRLRPRSAMVHLVTLALVASAAGAQVAHHFLTLSPRAFLGASPVEQALRWGALFGWIAAALFGFLIALLRRLTIFPAISTFGLYLGSAALVVVLSVMSGFEQDLKQKILGANAHLLITRTEGPFEDHRRAEPQVRGAVAGNVMPYLSSEVMIASQSNLADAILKGIDPVSAAQVTDLQRNLEQGPLDHLAHPEKLRTVGGPPPDLIDPDLPPEVLFPEDQARRAAQALGHADGGAPGPRDGGVHPDGAGDPAAGEEAKARQKIIDALGRPLRPSQVPAGRRVLPGVLIGRELAKNLRLYVGDDVNLISPLGDIGPAGPMPRSRPFRIAGIFYSGMYEYDTKYAYVAIPAAQKFLGLGDEISGFEVRLTDGDRTSEAVARVGAALGPGYEVQDWKELNRNLFSALKVEKVAMFVVLCFIILVAGFSIVANGVMLVREKRRDIAILKSMGAKDGVVMRAFLYMGFYMGLLGVLTGIAVGVIACLLLGRFGIPLESDVYYISKLPVRLNPWEIAAVFAAAMAIVLSATIYPALAAARLRPVDGLRYDQG